MTVLVQRGQEAFEDGHVLEWVRMRAKDPKALVFVPPLVGGTVAQQVRVFRWLVRDGFDLLTFNYSGHGRSTHRFSLGGTLRDVHQMLVRTRCRAYQERLPLMGAASCYSAIPLLHAMDRLCEPVERLVLINAILRLSPWSVTRSFFRYYGQAWASSAGFLGIRSALLRYADLLFPGIEKDGSCFGALTRRRARLCRTVSEFFTLDPLRRVRLERTRVLCLYAGNDPILKIHSPRSLSSYRKDIKRICPHSSFRALDGGHFLSGPASRGRATALITSFFGEPAGVPAGAP